MKKIRLVLRSGYGRAASQADGIVRGISMSANLTAIEQGREISAADWQALDDSDASVSGSPTYVTR
jgi:hypothetical protein